MPPGSGYMTPFNKDVIASMSLRLPPYWYTKLLSLCGIFFAVGLLPHVIPGPSLALYESWPSQSQQRAVLIDAYGLDRSVPVQYAIWLQRTVTGDWGRSRFNQRPVFSETLQATSFTLVLVLWTVLVCLVSIIIVSGIRRLFLRLHSPLPHPKLLALAAAFPTFLVAIVLHDVAIWKFGWFRLANPLHFRLANLLNPVAMLLPACILAIPPLLAWYSGGPGAHAQHTNHLDTPRVPRWRSFCYLFHPLLAGFLLEMLLVEHVMAMPGLGRLGIEALKRRDFPFFQGFLLWGGLLYLLLSILLELGAGRAKRPDGQALPYPARLVPPQRARLGLYGGMWGLLVLLVLASCTTQLLPYDPTEIHRHDQLLRSGYRYMLGTDFLGRDVLSRTLQGFRSALPRVCVITVLTGTIAWGVYWLVHQYAGPLRVWRHHVLAFCNAIPPFLLAFMAFLVFEHRPRPIDFALALACLPTVMQLMATPAAFAQQCANLSRLASHLLLLELSFFFLNLSPESLTPSWGSDIRLGMHYNHINTWLVTAPALAFTCSRYIFYHVSLYAASLKLPPDAPGTSWG